MADQERATNSNKPKCSAGKVFRVYMEKLMEAIQSADIPMVTVKLYSKEIISENTRDKVFLPILTKLEKNGILLTAVEDAIKTQPQVLLTLLDILNEFKPADLIAQKMRQQLDHSVPLEMYCETCHQLFCQHCSITDHKAHQYGLVADVFPKHKKELERDLTEVKQQLSILTTAQQVMKDRIDQISVQGKEVEQQIHTATQQAMERLQELEKRTIQMARKEVQRKSRVVSGQIEELTINYQQLLAFQKFVEEEVMAASPQQVLTVKHQKVERVRSVKSKVSSSNLQPMEAANIGFSANKELLSCASKLGDVYTLDIQRKGKGITTAFETSTFELTTSSSLPLNLNALSCQLTAPDSSEPVECTITPIQSGGCSISYTPAVRGPHQMRITVGGTDIPNSPFTIHVYPTPEMRGERIGTIDTRLNLPQGVAVSKNGEVVVSDMINCIRVFNRDKNMKGSFGSTGSDKGQFRYPQGIALTHDNHLLVVDWGNHRVQMFTLEGKFIKSVGEKGKSQLQFSYPVGIIVHLSSRQVFIADTGNHRIQVLNHDLTYSHEFGRMGSEDGQFKRPVDVACDSHGNVYVADSGNKRVQVLTSSGRFIDKISSRASLSPTGIAIDSMNTVYVSDGYTVSVFNGMRQFIKCFSSTRIYRQNSGVASFVEHMHFFMSYPHMWITDVGMGYFTCLRIPNSHAHFTGLAVDYTGNLLHVFPDCGAVAIF